MDRFPLVGDTAGNSNPQEKILGACHITVLRLSPIPSIPKDEMRDCVVFPAYDTAPH